MEQPKREPKSMQPFVLFTLKCWDLRHNTNMDTTARRNHFKRVA